MLSIILLLYISIKMFIIWGIIFIHSLYVFLYCYLRVIENVSHPQSLRRCLMFAAFQDTIFLGSFVYYIIYPHSSTSVTSTSPAHNDYEIKSIPSRFKPFGGGVFGTFLCVVFSIFCFVFLSLIFIMVFRIIKYNQHYITTFDVNGAYRFWLYWFMVPCIIINDV
eukprot:UN08806